MNQPLGRAVGNSLEVKECIEIMKGQLDDGTRPVLDLSLELAAHMLVLSQVDKTLESAQERLRKRLDSGAVLECFRQNVEAQGGDPRVCEHPSTVLPLVSKSVTIKSARAGFISAVATDEIGHAIAAIGGGRVRIEDGIDPTVGFLASGKIGDRVDAGDPLGVVYCQDQSKALEAAERIRLAYQIGNERVMPLSLIKEVINE
jgi:thymidine phosphorylase